MAAADQNDCPPWLREYIFYLRVIKNRSENTIQAYYSDLRLFFIYVNSLKNGIESDRIGDIPFSTAESITLLDVYEYLNFITTTENATDKTRSRKVAAIRGFYKAVTSNKLTSFHMAKNPVESLDIPSPKKPKPKYLDLDDSRRLVEHMDTEDANYRRDFCILMLFLNCGMRLSELVGIDMNDIKFEDRTLRILGKGNKERIIHLNEGCVQAIESYLEVRKECASNALFVSNRGTRITGRRVEQIVDRAIHHIGLEGRGLSAHKLRHTAATLMYQYGNVDPLVLKEILGHASISTTEIYTHLTNDNIRMALDSNPMADERTKA